MKRVKQRLLWAVVIAGIVLVASLGSVAYWVSLKKPSNPAQALADGPTFRQALDIVNVSVSNLTGGPWTLFSALGLAAQGPMDPSAFGFTYTNASLRSCGAAFNGVTIWNGTSLPVFNGSIESGTAPFWQFAFYSAVTQEFVVATDVSNVPRAYAPLSDSSPCGNYSGLGSAGPEYANWLNPLPIDTPAMARPAYDAVGEQFERSHGPIVEIYNFGYSILSQLTHGGNGEGLTVQYARCGLVGAGGLQSDAVVGESANGSVVNTDTGTLSCTWVTSSSPLIYGEYELAFGAPSPFRGPSPASQSIQINFSVVIPPGNTTFQRDAWGLIAWMTSLTLQNDMGIELPSAPPSCQGWVPSVTSCEAGSGAWAAVLLSANGAWTDSFPQQPNSTEWAIPNAPLVSSESLVILAPSSWVMEGFVVSVGHTYLVPVVEGSASL
jgi:hypothetical protein